MSRRFTEGYFALGLVLGAAVTIVLALAVSDYGAGCYLTDGISYGDKGQGIQPNKRCWLIPFFIYGEDTLAQWAMALLSLAAVYLLWGTLKASRKTLDITRKMAGDTRKIGESQTRAYVHVQRSEIFWDAAQQRDKVRIIFKNFGQTPAINVMLYGARKLGRPEPFSDDAPLNNGSEFSDMGPQADFTWSFDLDDPAHDEILPNGAQRQLRIVGRVEYVDVFGESRQTIFALKTNPTNDLSNAELHLAERANYGT